MKYVSDNILSIVLLHIVDVKISKEIGPYCSLVVALAEVWVKQGYVIHPCQQWATRLFSSSLVHKLIQWSLMLHNKD